MTRRKLWILILLAIAVVAILALAASVRELEFSPGDPFALGGGTRSAPRPAACHQRARRP